MALPTGSFYNYYQHYDYTYITSGAILVLASVFLFLGMGLNYHLLAKEKRQEEREARNQPPEERTAMLAPPAEPQGDPQADPQGDHKESPAVPAISLEDVARMDEDTV